MRNYTYSPEEEKEREIAARKMQKALDEIIDKVAPKDRHAKKEWWFVDIQPIRLQKLIPLPAGFEHYCEARSVYTVLVGTRFFIRAHFTRTLSDPEDSCHVYVYDLQRLDTCADALSK